MIGNLNNHELIQDSIGSLSLENMGQSTSANSSLSTKNVITAVIRDTRTLGLLLDCDDILLNVLILITDVPMPLREIIRSRTKETTLRLLSTKRDIIAEGLSHNVNPFVAGVSDHFRSIAYAYPWHKEFFEMIETMDPLARFVIECYTEALN